MHHFAALRYGNGRRNLSYRNLSARRRARTVERGLCPTVPAADGWAVRQQPVPAATLLSVSSLHQTIARRLSRTVSRLAALAWFRPAYPRYPFRGGQLGIA